MTRLTNQSSSVDSFFRRVEEVRIEVREFPSDPAPPTRRCGRGWCGGRRSPIGRSGDAELLDLVEQRALRDPEYYCGLRAAAVGLLEDPTNHDLLESARRPLERAAAGGGDLDLLVQRR